MCPSQLVGEKPRSKLLIHHFVHADDKTYTYVYHTSLFLSAHLDFPLPTAPTIATSSPFFTSRVHPCSAGVTVRRVRPGWTAGSGSPSSLFPSALTSVLGSSGKKMGKKMEKKWRKQGRVRQLSLALSSARVRGI